VGHQEGRRVFWEGPKIFELCPIVLNDVQHIFPGGGEALLVTGLLAAVRYKIREDYLD